MNNLPTGQTVNNSVLNTLTYTEAAKGDQKIIISYHPGITQNITKDQANFIVTGWLQKEIDWNEDSILDTVRNMGISPAFYANGIRENKAVTGFNSIMLDFDKGVKTFDEMKDMIDRIKFSAFLYTSTNHQKAVPTKKGVKPACDRYRVFIPLSTVITIEEFRKLAKVFEKKFNDFAPDTSTEMISRYYYCTPASVFFFKENPILNPYDLLSELDKAKAEKEAEKDRARAEKLKAKKEEKEQKEHSKRFKKVKKDYDDGFHFSKDDTVILKDLTEVPIHTIKVKTDIVCKFCNPKDRTDPDKYNALLNVSEDGTYTQWCFSEGVLRFQNPDEIDYSDSRLFFSKDTGTVIDVNEKGEMHTFVKEKDWISHCNNENIDPKCATYLPRLSATFSPKLPFGVIPDEKLFNIYNRPQVLVDALNNKIPEAEATLDYLQTKCPTISKVLWNLFGDDDTVDHFLNWIGYIIAGNKPFTTFLITSLPGAGKNVLLERVLANIIGNEYCTLEFSDRLTDKFNEANLILKGVDELYAANNWKLNEWRKNYIKSDIGSLWKTVELKGVNKFKIPNNMSYILFSNIESLAFAIDQQDRRFSVISNKDSKEIAKEAWWPGREKFEQMIADELYAFAIYIVSRNIDADKANTCIVNAAKQAMQDATEEDSLTFVRMLKNLDWNGFAFDEIFTGSGTFDISADTVLVECTQLKGIPAKYMKRIMKELLGSDRLSMKKRLQAQGLYNTVEKNSLGQSVKIYRAR